MKKRLFVCCDGTWNSHTQREFGLLAPTNVVKFANAIQRGVVSAGPNDATATELNTEPTCEYEQRVYYHPGVGAGEGMLDRILGGALGVGLRRNIKSAYKWLCDQYVVGDEIFIVGFSRGAFTARSLVGMIAHCGLIPGASWGDVEKAFVHYQKRRQRFGSSGQTAQQRFSTFCEAWHRQASACPLPVRPKIRFVGVWDTVGTLGIPQAGNLARVIEWLNPRWSYRFYDVSLSSLVQTARHALAADEQRQPFTATLWELVEGEQGRDVVQAWFPGCHSDVGGGFAESGLADLALEWMLREAQQCGAVFSDDMVAQAQHGDFQGPMHDPLTLVYNFMGARPRALPPFVMPEQLRSPLPHGQVVHPRTLARVQSPPLNDAPYRLSYCPQPDVEYTFEVYARNYWNAPGIYLQAGQRYQITAQGTWQDKNLTVGPQGGYGGFSALWLSLFSWVRRAPKADWLTLMASIGTGQAKNASNDMNRFPTYAVGTGGVIQPTQSGYVYFWGNDATGFYGNNRGGLQVTLSALPAESVAESAHHSAQTLHPLEGCEPGFWTLALRWMLSSATLAAGLYILLKLIFQNGLDVHIETVTRWLTEQIGLPNWLLNAMLTPLLQSPLLCFWGITAASLFVYSHWFAQADTRVQFVPVRLTDLNH